MSLDSRLKADPNSNRSRKRREKKQKRRLGKIGCVVYGLKAKSDGVCRYIGQTRCLLETRMMHHRKKVARGTSDLYQWWRWREAEGDEIEIYVVQGGAIWNVSEIQWITRLTDSGHTLTNTTPGGNSPIQRRKALVKP